jgi:hypothetical protein
VCKSEQAGPARDEDWEQHEWTEEHEGDRWLAVCSADMALHMAHQGFVLALAPSAASLSPFVTSKLPRIQPWTQTLQVELQLARLARLHGHELAGLWVRCPVPGQESESVPIVLVRRCTNLPPGWTHSLTPSLSHDTGWRTFSFRDERARAVTGHNAATSSSAS